MIPSLAASTDISIGEHVTFQFLGMTFNADTILSSVVAGVIVIAGGFWMRAKVTSDTPSKIQVFWEFLVETVTKQVNDSLGRVNPFVVPLAIALFCFILIANVLELIPTMHNLTSPTSDVNLTYAMAIFVVIGVHVYSIRERGLKDYVTHYFKPYLVLSPLNILEEITKPITLALRLFGNIFATGIMLSIIGLLPGYIFWFPNAAWKLFDLFIATMQAFIFALLTIIYFGLAGKEHDDVAKDDVATDDVPEQGRPDLAATTPGQPQPQPEVAR